jgi:hypothetical protein
MPAERMRIGDRTLPVRRLKERIIDKIKLNRVTFICGFTGYGILASTHSLFFSCLFLSLSFSLLVSFSAEEGYSPHLTSQEFSNLLGLRYEPVLGRFFDFGITSRTPSSRFEKKMSE